MTRIQPRWWWRTLASRPAKLVPLVALAAMWATYVAGWIDAATFFAAVLVALVFELIACGAHVALVVRRVLIQASWRWAE